MRSARPTTLQCCGVEEATTADEFWSDDDWFGEAFAEDAEWGKDLRALLRARGQFPPGTHSLQSISDFQPSLLHLKPPILRYISSTPRGTQNRVKLQSTQFPASTSQ